MCAWIQTSDTGLYSIASKQLPSGSNWKGYNLFANGYGAGTIGGAIGNSFPSNALEEYTGSTSINNGSWHHVVMSYDGSSAPSGLKLYLDNSEISTTTQYNTLTSCITSTASFYIGNRGNNDSHLTGKLDEIRVLSVTCSAALISTVYNNTNSPSTFYTVGDEESSFPSAVGLEVLEAVSWADGVAVRWRTGFEVDNLGFHVHRERDGERIRLTEELIAGSALSDASGAGAAGGGSYAWWDPEGTADARYWLEDVDLDGTRTLRGPVAPAPSPESAIDGPSPPLRLVGRPADRRFKVEGQDPGVSSYPRARLWVQSESPRGSYDAQWVLAAAGAVKMSVRDEGWHRIGQDSLLAAGLDPGIDPRTLRLFADGRELPIIVTGQYDRRFDPGDAIEFYGRGLDTPWADARTYWLAAGSKAGRRIPAIRYRGPGAESPPSFPCTVERRDRTVYFAALRNGEEDNLFGPVIAGGPVESSLHLDAIDPASPTPALLEITLQGVTTSSHRVAVSFNGAEVGEIAFEGQVRWEEAFAIPLEWLREGEDTVALAAQEGETDVCLIDAIRLSYWRSYIASADSLLFSASGGRWVTVRGFTDPAIRIADITDPIRISLLRGDVNREGSGHSIRFKAPATGNRILLAFTEESLRGPAEIAGDSPSAWHADSNEADLLIIGPPDLLVAVGPLAEWRRAQGLAVEAIDVQDIYDEFAFGAKDPAVIRGFLRRAHERWTRAPRFVLLVGDASFDARDRLGLGASDRMPTKYIDTAFLETASDDWFADFDEDGVPEMAIGRLPARDADEAAAMAAKIIAYDQAPGTWTRRALFVAGSDRQFDFPGTTRSAEALLSPAWTSLEAFLNQGPSARDELLRAIEEGTGLVYYMGHGSVEIWQDGLVSSRDARALENGIRLPLVIPLTCLNGFFHDLYTECLAEAFLRAEGGGAAAVWASSGLTSPPEQEILGRTFLEALLGDASATIGQAAARAKAAVADPDVRRTWILFGDPATRIR